MGKIKIAFQKIVFGAIFCIILPALLVFWANQTETMVYLPVPNLPWIDIILSALGLLMILGGMSNLWFQGKGLPMNAFPPKFYVRKGWYYFFHHPIYVGAVLLSAGLSLYFQSASGFWLITPVLILLILSYVQGFENELIAKNFDSQKHQTFFDFPGNTIEKASLKDKVLIFVWVFLPWLLLYESFIYFKTPIDAISTKLFFDDWIPFLDFSVLFYVLLYPLVILLPFFLQTKQQIRTFVFDAIVGMCIGFYTYLVFPFVVPYETIENQSIFTYWIIVGREVDGQTAALPSFHVFWALIFAKYFGLRFPKLKILGTIIAWLIVISCLTTYNHTILDVVFGIITFILVDNRNKLYTNLLKFCEKISNSWKEWRIGKIRIINHGFYAAMGGVSGFLIIGYFLPDYLFVVYLIGISGFVGAGLWAQFVEGSPALLRPYGYYGSVIGVGLTIVGVSIFTELDLWTLIGVSALAASSIQFFGRFRCLVQGCCHGKPTDQVKGICFHHPKSRVHKLAGWTGKNLYPTQFYSIATNFLTFFFLFRLVSLAMPMSFVAGMYLILNGSFRFVEESLRGEPQTPYFMGMRVYQCLAMASILLGIFLTCVESPSFPSGRFDGNLVLYSILYGCMVLFAYGIDFPESNRRFSRLTQ